MGKEEQRQLVCVHWRGVGVIVILDKDVIDYDTWLRKHSRYALTQRARGVFLFKTLSTMTDG